MTRYFQEDRETGADRRIRASILESLANLHGEIHPRRLAWDIAMRLRVPAYRVFRACMELAAQGEILERHGRLRGMAATPSLRRMPKLQSDPGKVLLQEIPYQRTDRGRWDFFRELLAYYTQCIRLEEGATAKVWQDRLGELFLFLDDAGCWYPRDGVLWRKTIPFARISGAIRELWRNAETTTLMLGYPVSAVAGKNGGVLLRPVFCHVLDHRITAAGLEISARQTRPAVNAEWLDYAFATSSEKRTFLEACGLCSSGDDDSAPENSDDAPDFLQLAQALSLLAERRIREPLDPRCLSGRPLEPECRTGLYNRAIIVASRSSPYSRRLIAELETIARAPDALLDRTALAHVFVNARPAQTKPAAGAVVTGDQPLTGTQRRAVASLLQCPLTVIQGPPGAGKSQVVSSAVLNACLRGQSVLISSYNHKAIDAVMERLPAPEGGRSPVVRCNSREDPNLAFGIRQALRQMLTMPLEETGGDEQLEQFRRLLDERGARSLEAETVERHGQELGELGEALEACLAGHAWLSSFSESDVKDAPLYRKAARLARLCEDRTPFQTFFLRGNVAALLHLWRACRALRRRRPDAPAYSWTASPAAQIGPLEEAARLLELKEKIAEQESILKALPSLESLSSEVVRLDALISARLPAIRRQEAARRETLPPDTDRARLKGVERALAATESALASSDVQRLLYKELPERLPAVLRAFPCWAVTSLSAGRFLPLVPGMFDLTLVDEASQSNIPSAIPLLFRARRAGIIGDPCQLRFVSRMTADREALLQKELRMTSLADLRFTFADNSLYDLAASSTGATTLLLDSTFRSTGDIAEYCNRLFYGGSLRTATDEQALRRPRGSSGALEWRSVQGEIRRGAGQRSCWCPQEVEQVVELVRELLITAGFEGSLGIVTPFREQAQRVEDLLEISGIDRELLRRARVQADTVHGFQGDERDVMILSLCAGEGLPHGALHFLRENASLFNVAVSRARAKLYLVGNREWAESCGIAHIELLAAPSRLQPRPPQKTPWYPYESPYEKLLAEALRQAGLDPLPQVSVGWRRLDLALRDPTLPACRLDIEVDGACHRDARGHRKSDDLWRTLELTAAGWRVIRFWTYQLREDLPGCVARVQAVWNEMREQYRTGANV